MAGIIDKLKGYRAEIVLVGLYLYVLVLLIATLREFGIL